MRTGRTRSRRSRAILTLLPPKLDSEILATVQHALLENRELLVDYRRLKDDMPVTRRLHPRALLQSGPVTYLIATQPDTDKDPDKPIQYRLDRIQKAVTSGRGVSRSSFNLEQYLAAQEHRVGDLEWLDLELWVSEDLAKILRETALSDDQELIEISRRKARFSGPECETRFAWSSGCSAIGSTLRSRSQSSCATG
jgi:predicted DNA-binding transcriptional regulator YafY